jgi:hypothetical protein
MAIFFPIWGKAERNRSFARIIIIRVIIFCLVLPYILIQSTALETSFLSNILLVFALLSRMVFDSLYGYARAVIDQFAMAVLTCCEACLLIIGLIVLSLYSSSDVDFMGYCSVLFVTYFVSSIVGGFIVFKDLCFRDVKFPGIILNFKFRKLLSTGLSIYPIACIDTLWLAGILLVLNDLGQLELIPLFMVLQRFCTLTALVYSIPNQLLSQIIAQRDKTHKIAITLVGFISIGVAGGIASLLIFLFLPEICGLFNITYDLGMSTIAYRYLFGYVLILYISLFSSILLSRKCQKLVLTHSVPCKKKTLILNLIFK